MSRFLILTIALLGFPLTVLAEQPTSIDADQTEMITGNNTFANELYQQLKNQPGNLFFSPTSISTALAMTYAGARGETATEMAKALHYTLPSERLHTAMGAILRDLNIPYKGYQLHIANALWGQQGYEFLADFLKLTNEDYGAGFSTVDFKGAAGRARQTINQWVEGKTEKRIKELLQPGILTPATRLVLTNAVYFKGDWETQFKKEETREDAFHLSPTQLLRTPMMHRTGGFNYLDGGTFQALEIPYSGEKLSMVAFLPKKIDGLPAVEQQLTPGAMRAWLGQLRHVADVIVSMPQFKMEERTLLGSSLMAMGVRRAFAPTEADFSNMASRNTMRPDGNLYISAVVHNAYIAVNEEGTVATAATAIIMPAAALSTRSRRPIVFNCNHPFLFLIRDNRSGCILFMGRVNNPGAGNLTGTGGSRG